MPDIWRVTITNDPVEPATGETKCAVVHHVAMTLVTLVACDGQLPFVKGDGLCVLPAASEGIPQVATCRGFSEPVSRLQRHSEALLAQGRSRLGGRVRWRARRAGWQSSCAARTIQSRNDTKQITAQVYTALGNAHQSLGNFAAARGAHAPCQRLQRTNILPWMVCCCLLGWSASSHELECAQVHCLRRQRRRERDTCFPRYCVAREARGNAPNARQRLHAEPSKEAAANHPRKHACTTDVNAGYCTVGLLFALFEATHGTGSKRAPALGNARYPCREEAVSVHLSGV